MAICGNGQQASQRRVNGFSRPFTNDQMLSWVAEPVAAVLFYLIVGTFTSGSNRAVLVAVFTVLLVIHIASWLACSLPDPSKQTTRYWPCMKEAQQKERYCAVCHKTVPGLDHHCTWLNTCIGKSQYGAFFTLVVVGTGMFWFETAIFISLLTHWLTPEVEARALDVLGSLTTYKALVGAATVIVGILALSLSILFVFHMFLQTQGMGTYAFMLEGRNKKVKKNFRKNDIEKSGISKSLENMESVKERNVESSESANTHVSVV